MNWLTVTLPVTRSSVDNVPKIAEREKNHNNTSPANATATESGRTARSLAAMFVVWVLRYSSANLSNSDRSMAGSEWYSRNFELMRKYRTLERPYTRKEIVQVLELAGFGHFEFFAQVNGFFNTADTSEMSN